MLTRRAFHRRLLALAMTTALPRISLASPGNTDDTFLNRLTFGANDASRAALQHMGRAAWLDAQLTLAPDPALDQRLSKARLHIRYDAGDDGDGRTWPAMDDLRPLTTLSGNPATRLPLRDFANGMDFAERLRPAHEVIAASLIRAVHSRAQVQEVMTQFWHDHFNVNAIKDENTAVFFPEHDAVIRAHALGNFRTMLGDIARSPAMLYYLNNADSRASPANENFARELLELHTLGAEHYINDTAPDWRMVPGADQGLALAYIDQDVYEVARAFTGWSVGDGRYVSEGVLADQTGRFTYIDAFHDPYQKRILAVEFGPNQGPMADGDRVLDLLSIHPGTARFVSRKIIRRLLTDDPDPAMVDRIAAVFLHHHDAPDQIAHIIRAIVADPAFDATPPGKFRRPFEFLAGLYRATGIDITATDLSFDWQLSRAGWRQHSYGPPTGHPDRANRWAAASTMARMVDLALYAHDDWFGTTITRLSDLAPKGASFDDIARFWVTRLHGPQADPAMTHLAAAYGITDGTVPMDLSDDDAQGLSASIVAFAAISPTFMQR